MKLLIKSIDSIEASLQIVAYPSHDQRRARHPNKKIIQPRLFWILFATVSNEYPARFWNTRRTIAMSTLHGAEWGTGVNQMYLGLATAVSANHFALFFSFASLSAFALLIPARIFAL